MGDGLEVEAGVHGGRGGVVSVDTPEHYAFARGTSALGEVSDNGASDTFAAAVCTHMNRVFDRPGVAR